MNITVANFLKSNLCNTHHERESTAGSTEENIRY